MKETDRYCYMSWLKDMRNQISNLKNTCENLIDEMDCFRTAFEDKLYEEEEE